MEGLRRKLNFISIDEIGKGQWIFVGVLIALAFLAWFSFYLIIYQVFSGWGAWIFSAFSLLALAVSVGLSFFLLEPKRIALASYASVSLIAFLFFGWRGIEIFAVLVFFIATFLGYKWVNWERARLIPFLYSRLIRRGMPIFFTGLAFALALFYNTSPAGRVAEVPEIPEGAISALLVPAEYGVRTYIPQFRRNLKIVEIMNLETAAPIRNYFSRISPEDRGKTVSEFFADLINSQFRATILPYKQFLPFVYLFGLFLVFRAIAMPIMWLSIGVGWLVIKIMLARRVLKLRKVSVAREELIL